MANELLAGVPLFSGLSAEILEQLGGAMKTRHLARGQAPFFKDDPGDHLYVIRSGEMKLLLTEADGQESILDVLREGDYFGEMAILDAQPRSADAMASQETVLLSLHRDDFRALLQRYPGMAFPIFAALCQRLRRTTHLLEETLFLDLPTRIARVLLRLANDHGEETPEGLRIDRPVTQQEIADMVGATRPRVSEHLQSLRRQKIIDLERRSVQILRLDSLTRLAGG